VDPVQTALYAVVVPAAAAAAVLFAVRAATKGRAGATGVGLAIAAGFVASFLAVVGLPSFPPKEAWHWLPVVAAAAAAIGAVEARLHEYVRAAMRVVVVVIAVFGAVPQADRASVPVLAIAVAALVSARSLDALSRLGGPRTALAPVVVTAFAAAVCMLVFSGWIGLGMLCGALAAATGACFVLGLKLPTDARDASLPAAMLLAAAAANGAYYADLPRASAVLLALAPAGGLLTVGLLARRGGPMRLVLRAAGGAAIPAGIAIALAAHAAPKLEY
jgi:hypothetical protein